MGKKTERECIEKNKQSPKDFIPITLYHVSVDVDKVCDEGLKTYSERIQETRKPQKDVKIGIGGSTDNKISTSYDKELVDGYFTDIIITSKIANGSLTPNNMCQYLDKHDKNKNMTKSPCDIWNSLNNTNEYAVSGLRKGELNLLEEGKILNKDKNTFEKAEPDQIQEKLKQWWIYGYLKERRDHGGRKDPYFWGVDLKKYQKDPTKIGIVQLQGYLPKQLSQYKDYMNEFHSRDYDPQDGFPDETKYKDKFRILLGESEIRLTPDWYNQLKIIKRGK